MVKVAKKVYSTVSDQLAEKLEQRAEQEGRSLSNLINYLLERHMEDWQPQAKEPPSAKGK